MSIRDLAPWNWGKKNVPVRREERDPFLDLERRLGGWFDDFWRDFPLADWREPFASLGDFSPRVELEETAQEYKVHAELPGLTEQDIEVTLTDGELTLRGEKKSETSGERDGRGYTERRYGSFSRRLALPGAVEAEQVQAEFKNGVLTVKLPKSRQAAEKARQIAVKRN